MTFDDGILKVCGVTNTAESGDKPKYELTEKARFYFSFDVLGIQRYFTALEAKAELSHVVNIPGWNELDPRDIVVLEDDKQYRLAMVQPMKDDNGLRITKLSLERISECYEFAEDQTNP